GAPTGGAGRGGHRGPGRAGGGRGGCGWGGWSRGRWSLLLLGAGGEGARVRGVGVARLPGIGESLVDESGAGESGGGVGEREGRGAVVGADWEGKIWICGREYLDGPGQCEWRGRGSGAGDR